ncbi:neuronal acetylcholine receptor subunit non-alpha-2-like, partial [Ylistrum balloti]|uniref:neuronal acetylcholine receptor subunit non-alpha-2-like n=1 Tax=Ylistrum balloti TaxID=509963 RepID=UPI0029058D41
VRSTDIFVRFSIDRIDSHFLDNILDDVYHITSDGMVSVTLNGIISIACHMDPKNFPFDCQKCSVVIDYGGRSKDYVKFKDSGYSNYPTVYHESKTWSLLSTTLEIPNNYDGTIFFFDIVLKRKPYYYVIMIVFPSVLLSFVTLAVYFIPSEEGERIGCGMTILLSFTVFLSQVAEHLPENSDTLPAIGLYFLLVMTSSTLVIVDSVIMANRTSSSPLSKENDETETIEKPDGSDFVGVKTKTCRRNRSAVYHHILGIICFTMIASAHIVLFAKSISTSCDNVGL